MRKMAILILSAFISLSTYARSVAFNLDFHAIACKELNSICERARIDSKNVVLELNSMNWGQYEKKFTNENFEFWVYVLAEYYQNYQQTGYYIDVAISVKHLKTNETWLSHTMMNVKKVEEMGSIMLELNNNQTVSNLYNIDGRALLSAFKAE